MGLLDGKVAVVTGAGHGIGRGHAMQLAKHGAKVVINDLGGSVTGEGSGRDADLTVGIITERGGQAVANYADVSNYEAAGTLISDAVEAFGRFDILVNNAGIVRDSAIWNMSESDFDSVIAVHLKGTWGPCKHAALHWREQNKSTGAPVGGRIINTISGAGLTGNFGQTNYAPAKAAIASLTQTLSLELYKLGVTVNAVGPAAATRITATMPNAPAVIEPDDIPDDEWNRMDPAVSSPLVAWLASDEADHVTGQIIRAVAENIIWMTPWSDGASLSNGGKRWDATKLGTQLATDIFKTRAPRAPLLTATDAGPTVGDLLADLLRVAGVTRVWDAATSTVAGSMPITAVGDDPDLALLLADAAGRITGGLGAALVPGGVLHLSSKPGGTAAPLTVTTAAELEDAFASLPDTHLPHTAAIHLDLDLGAPAPSRSPGSDERVEGVVVTLNPSFADARVVVVVGPGVVRGGYLAGVDDLTRRTGWTVLNTWGAKGVLPWYDLRHAGTGGLQARDVELAGLAEADLVIAAGLDPDELGVDDLGSALVQEVEPWQLAALTYHWSSAGTSPPEQRSLLYERISAAVTPMYESASVPLAPARAALHLSGARPDGGLVVADAGPAGFWLARTFPTREPGSVIVPATRQPGFAVAAALVAAVEGRPCVAVVDGPLDEPSQIVLEAAAALEADVAVQAWGSAGSARDVDAHARVSEAQFSGQRGVVEVPVRLADLEQLVDIAGPITAWGGV